MKQQYDRNDLYILNHLRGYGLQSSMFGNFITGCPLTMSDAVASLKKLQKTGLIHISGPKSIQDLENLRPTTVDTPLPEIKSTEGSSGLHWTATYCAIFQKAQLEKTEEQKFFSTDIRLTLRGHAFMLFKKKTLGRDILKEIAHEREKSSPPPASP